MPKKYRFRGLFDKQHGKRAQSLLKSVSHHLYQVDWSHPNSVSWKKCLLLTCQILGLLPNTLADDKRYLVLPRNNLTIAIEILLSQKQKTFSQSFSAFLKSTLTFDNSENKDDTHSFCISEITDSENVVR